MSAQLNLKLKLLNLQAKANALGQNSPDFNRRLELITLSGSRVLLRRARRVNNQGCIRLVSLAGAGHEAGLVPADLTPKAPVLRPPFAEAET